MATLNLGILAHVDAGKTSLTERLLFAAGVIDELGSVDAGSTRTDSLALERRRGITIRSAVVSFALAGVTVNLIDTPGHPDFIAEVERVLAVLDGAVLVVSAVEGVQAQTRVLMRTLQRLRIPTLIFVNKTDRAGADPGRVLGAIAARLTPAAVAMGRVTDPGTPGSAFAPFGPADPAFTTGLTELLADRDDALLAAYLDGGIPYRRLRAELAAQTGRALVHPVYFGSAITGAGVDALGAAVARLLPATRGDAGRPVSGTVFKVERGPAGEKVAYARLFAGTLRVRDRVAVPGGHAKVTAIEVFDRGAASPRGALVAGRIGRLWGLAGIRIGDPLGVPPEVSRQVSRHAPGRQFAPPTLETVVLPRRPAQRAALHTALAQLAEQDPLIDLRRDEIRGEATVSLYGEVQKEVIEATLADEYGLAVGFGPTTTVCVERPAGTGAAFELIGRAPNPFHATVGLRVEPGNGVRFRLAVEAGSLPPALLAAVEETVHAALRQGLRGWQVTDCGVTLTHSGFWSPSSTAADFRNLTPLVLMAALRRAGTTVCEPVHRFALELPAGAVGGVLPALTRLGAVPRATAVRGGTALVEGDIPAARVYPLQRRLPGLTLGEGVLECAFDRYEPVRGPLPSRPRTDHNPLDRKEYLRHVLRRT